MKTRLLVCGFVLAAASGVSLHATPLTEGTFTDIVRTVEVLEQPSKTASPAALNEVVKAPNLVRTGAGSRAELTAPDQTLTRIGANTVFSFAPTGREINLEQGSVLFHSPSGRGGGAIRSGGASAAVSGTTLIVATTPVKNPGDQNGFKVILLEGHGRVTLANGRYKKLKAGQMIFILPNHKDFGPLLTINLSKLVGGSALVKGFSHGLPSLPLIEAAIQQQEKELAKGDLTDTGTPADHFANNPPQPGNGWAAGPGGDPNTYQIGMQFPPIHNYNIHQVTFFGETFNTGPAFPTGPSLLPPPPIFQLGLAGPGVIANGGSFSGSDGSVISVLGSGTLSGYVNSVVTISSAPPLPPPIVTQGIIPASPATPVSPVLGVVMQMQNRPGLQGILRPPLPPLPPLNP